MLTTAAGTAPPRFARDLLVANTGVKLLTLAIVRSGDRLLLGRKKRGFGAGYVNGFGGKVEPGEGVREAAAREIREEAGVEPGPLRWRGVLTFCFDDQPRPWEVHVFAVDGFEGAPAESDEMAPEWFDADLASIPFDQMWADDRLWWPLLLRADAPLFRGVFAFERTHEMRWWALAEARELPGPPPLQLLEEAEAAAAAAAAAGCSSERDGGGDRPGERPGLQVEA